jgi:hypothetical protein
LVERLLCKQDVRSSILLGSTVSISGFAAAAAANASLRDTSVVASLRSLAAKIPRASWYLAVLGIASSA